MATEFRPDWAVPPGEILQEWLDVHLIDVESFAQWANQPTAAVKNLLAGETELDPDMSIKLYKLTNIPPEVWDGLESTYRAWLKENGQ